jgi:outer membrane autotransporter protein
MTMIADYLRTTWTKAAGVVLFCVLSSIATFPVRAQTLDEAVQRQLDRDPSGAVPCFTLLGPDSASVLVGALNAICTRTQPLGGAGPVASSGGSSAAPAMLPAAIQQRMENARNDKQQAADAKPHGASIVSRLDSGLSVFLSGEIESLNKEITTFEDGYSSDLWRLTTGVDYPLTDKLTVGLTVNYGRQRGDFDSGSDFQNDSFGILAYSSVHPAKEAFVQLAVGYTRKEYERKRVASFKEFDGSTGSVFHNFGGSLDGNFNASEISAHTFMGYDITVGNVTFGPRAGADWVHTEFDDYVETGSSGLELMFHGDQETSLQSSIGLWGSVAMSTNLGVVVFQESIYWKHEHRRDQRDVTVSFAGDTRAKPFSFQTEPPDRTFREVNFGLSIVLPGGIQAFANYRTLLGHGFFDNHAFSAGLRREF